MTIDDVIKFIRDTANKEVDADDPEYRTCDYTGGNIDDAFGLGLAAGRVWFAREVIKMLMQMESDK